MLCSCARPPPALLPPPDNSAWGYWVTDAVGIFELLSLCELAHAAPQLSVYTGYSMGAQYIPLNQSQVFAQDALDMVEFTAGDKASPFGRMRAAAGHPAPFVTDLSQLRLEVSGQWWVQCCSLVLLSTLVGRGGAVMGPVPTVGCCSCLPPRMHGQTSWLVRMHSHALAMYDETAEGANI